MTEVAGTHPEGFTGLGMLPRGTEGFLAVIFMAEQHSAREQVFGKGGQWESRGKMKILLLRSRRASRRKERAFLG